MNTRGIRVKQKLSVLIIRTRESEQDTKSPAGRQAKI